MNYIDIPIFYINLKKDNQRNKSFINAANKYNLNINRVEAINGYDFKDKLNIIKVNGKNYKFKIKCKKYPLPSQLGCCLSHLKAIIHIKDLGLESAIIMEDDIDFSLFKKWTPIVNFKNILKCAPKDWELIKLHSSNRINQNYIYDKFLKESKLYLDLDPYNLKNWSTMCYIINKNYINSFFEKYYIDDCFIFDINFFVADIVMYFKKNLYNFTIPLFKSKNFNTNIFFKISHNQKNPYDERSNVIIDNFWENLKIEDKII